MVLVPHVPSEDSVFALSLLCGMALLMWHGMEPLGLLECLGGVEHIMHVLACHARTDAPLCCAWCTRSNTTCARRRSMRSRAWS